MSSTDRFARRLDRLEKGLLAAQTQPRLPYSSIDGGSLVINDPATGLPQSTIGQQWDGTFTSASHGGTIPPSPTVPLVTPRQGGLALFWDGTYVDNSPARMDFRRVTFHAVTDPAALDVLDPTQLVGEITIATGGEIFAALPPLEYFVFAVTWTDSGKFSVESDVAFGIPLSLVDEAAWQEHEAALNDLHNVQIPGLNTRLAAAEADVATLETTTIPGLNTRLAAAEADVATLETTTIPGLNTRLSAAEADVATLETTTIPGLQAELDASQVDITNATNRLTTAEGNIGTLQGTTIPALDAELEQAKIDLALADAKIASRGTDLIINGTGAMGDATNFTGGFTVDKTDVPNGLSASFRAKYTYAYTAVSDNLIPYNPAKKHRFSFQIRQTVAGATNRAYGFLAPYDQWGNSIQPTNYMFIADTTTTLAQPLNPGDTTITLTSAANWYGSTAKPAGSTTSLRRIIFWDWVDPNGKTWPEHTYSRDTTANDMWADGGVNGNVITLRSPWAGTAKPAGAKLSNGSSGGTYIYMPSLTNGVVPEQWTTYSDVHAGGIMSDVTAAQGRALATWTTGMPPGTAQVLIGWLLNYPPSPANPIVGRHSIAGISLSDASAAQVTADASATRITDWTTTGQTTIDGGKITADSVASAQIAADAITANELAANSVTASKIVSRAITALQIAADTITANEIATGTITASEIAADTITANELAAGAVTATELAANAVTAGKIAAGTIVAADIAADTITSAQIAAGAITAAEIAAGAVVAGKIGANAITAAEIAADAITASEIAAGAVTANELAANAVIAGKIAAGTIVAADIATGAIVADKIGANQVTAGKIAVDAITSGTIAANAITAKHTITGATFQTHPSANTGLKIVGNVLTAYDGSGVARFIANGSDGSVTVVGGTYKTAASGERLEIGTTPASGSQLKFYSAAASEVDPSTIQGDDQWRGNLNIPNLLMIGGRRSGHTDTRPSVSLLTNTVGSRAEMEGQIVTLTGNSGGTANGAPYAVVQASTASGSTSPFAKIEAYLNGGTPGSVGVSPGAVHISGSMRGGTPGGTALPITVHSAGIEIGTKPVLVREDASWVTAPLANGWQNFGSPWGVARYRKTGGIVYIEGLVTKATGPTSDALWNLPAGYRPNQNVMFVMPGAGLSRQRFDIETGGNVSFPEGANAGWVSIACSFFADQ